jgi:hypothetical protein
MKKLMVFVSAIAIFSACTTREKPTKEELKHPGQFVAIFKGNIKLKVHDYDSLYAVGDSVSVARIDLGGDWFIIDRVTTDYSVVEDSTLVEYKRGKIIKAVRH